MRASAAWRAPPVAEGRRRLRATLVTALGLPALGLALRWAVPAGCALRGPAETYRWTCLFPGLLLVVPVVAALVLGLVAWHNTRAAHRLPDGWLATPLLTGLAAQFGAVVAYLCLLGPADWPLFLGETLRLPQPFVAGALSGLVFWGVLHWRA